jgi:hypothetical protein
VVLDPRGAELAVLAVEAVLRDGRRNGRAAPPDLAALAAVLAATVPDVAARLPEVSQCWSSARAEPGLTLEAPVRARRMRVPDAAHQLGLTDRAIRAACLAGRLRARRTPAGRWVIAPASIEDYGRRRRARAG